MANPEHVAIVQQGAKAIAEWRLKYRGKKLDLSGADLRGIDLNGAELPNVNLEGAILNRANLSCTDFREANLSGADLSEADLMCACFVRADLSKADLRNANLNQTNFSGSNLTEADFSEAFIKNAKFKNTKGLDLGNVINQIPTQEEVIATAPSKSKGRMSKGLKVILFFFVIFLVTLIPNFLIPYSGAKTFTTAEFLAVLIPSIAFILFFFSVILGAAMIATEKGYSVVIGLLLALSLSVVGLLILIFLPEKQNQKSF